MLSALWTDTNIDAAQTAAIITLTCVVVVCTMRESARIAQVHEDLQDAIRSQWDLLKQIKENGEQIRLVRQQIATLTREMAEKCSAFEARIRELEGVSEPPRTFAAPYS